MASRVGVSLACALGLEAELVALSAKDFEDLVARVADDGARRAPRAAEAGGFDGEFEDATAGAAAADAARAPPLAAALRRRVARAALDAPLFDALGATRRAERA